jgi:hypothetical protein
VLAESKSGGGKGAGSGVAAVAAAAVAGPARKIPASHPPPDRLYDVQFYQQAENPNYVAGPDAAPSQCYIMHNDLGAKQCGHRHVVWQAVSECVP